MVLLPIVTFAAVNGTHSGSSQWGLWHGAAGIIGTPLQRQHSSGLQGDPVSVDIQALFLLSGSSLSAQQEKLILIKTHDSYLEARNVLCSHIGLVASQCGLFRVSVVISISNTIPKHK